MRPTRRWWLVLGVPPVAVVGLVLCIPVLLFPGSTGAASTGSVSGVPDRVLVAYRAVDGWCTGLRWQLIAGIGFVESGHGTAGGAAPDQTTGEVRAPIFGPPLDGSAGVMRLPIGQWLGRFGLPGPWQQAVGPMQFLPGTFEAWGVDADGDGVANPHDIDDAAASAANYLCGGRGGEIADERAALLRYNHDEGYVSRVLAYADQVGRAASAVIVCPVAGPTTFTNAWLAPRSGGRQHKGVDMFAPEGTPVVAPVGGELELRGDTLGGLAFHLWGDDGNYYYGAHLSGFATASGTIPGGTVVGYIGTTGNAAATAPHLHFEIHPQRTKGDPPSPVDPTDAVAAACAR
ncbi:MAG: M23 family metallopeptidase [Actinomycetota bacterium]|nr:M23 family metallopeptidase [Actinomycetota bacterium]